MTQRVTIGELLPAAVAAAEAFDDFGTPDLFAQEQPVVARAVAGRRLAFTTGRACARRALAELGVAPVAILPDERGAPAWPPGIVGSITHCDGYRAAAVARSRQVISVGIDAEPAAPLPRGLLRRVALVQEQGDLRGLARRAPAVFWEPLLFSAKESVYKAWYPLTGRPLGLADVQVSFDLSGTFSARLLLPAPRVGAPLLVSAPNADARPLQGFSGRWLQRDGLLLTAVAVMSDAESPVLGGGV